MSIKIALVGDIMLGRTFRKYSSQHTPICIKLLELLKESDIVTGNLETTITNSSLREIGKTFHFKMKPSHLDWLNIFTYLSLANNHILDYGLEGMNDTIKNLERGGIYFSGAGQDINDSRKMKTINQGGQTIGFISATDHYLKWSSTPTKAGVNYVDMKNINTPKTQLFLKYVSTESQKVDYMVMYLHWGSNYMEYIPKWMETFGQALIDNGVTIVAGTSPHHTFPIEKYKNGIIFYSLGDFIDDYAIDPKFRNDKGMIGLVELDKGIVSKVKLIPTIIKDLVVHLN